MSRALRHTFLVIATVALVAAGGGVAQAADKTFSVRWAQTLRGDVLATGNTSLSCPTANANCANARNRVGSNTDNNDFTMANVDIDGDGTTFNSSRATIALPAGATLAWAGLYWAADTSAGGSGSAAPTAANRGQVRVKVGSGAYQTVNSTETLTSTPQPTRFRAFADITSLLGATGSQDVTVANIQAGRGTDRFAGWSLLVAYRDATKPIRRLNVYDGLGTVDATHSFNTIIAPFQTPATGTVTSRVGLVSFEGDDGITGETGKFNGVDMTDALNPANNFQNSTIESDGADLTAKSPNYRNQLGVDIDSRSATGVLANSQSSALLAFTSTQDYFMPSAFFLVSDEGPALNTGAPTVTGTARDGQTLTAGPGTWSGTPTVTYTYQWQRCDAAGANCANISGATGATYTLTAADAGSTVRVRVVATNDAGSSPPASSSVTTTVAKKPPVSVTAPTVSGTARDEATLTSTTGTWDGTAPLAYTYQWQRCDTAGNNCVAIPGATASTYTLADADVGSTIRSTVRASNEAGNAVRASAPSAVVLAAPPADKTPPVLSGTTRDGQVLTASTGTWGGTGPFTYGYEWLRCDTAGNNCTVIGGATGSTYELTDDDVDHTVRARVTATNPLGSDTSTSTPSALVTPAPPANAVLPALTGTARDDQTLSATAGAWGGTGPFDFAYQWQRCDTGPVNCVAIGGATGASYTLTDADAGKVVRVVVSATNDAGTATSASVPTAVVAMAPPTSGGAPGVDVSGGTLTAGTGSWTGTGPYDFTYQWERCDADGDDCVPIAGATGATYDLTADDVGHSVRAVVTATNPVGTASAVSAPSAPVLHDPPAAVPGEEPAVTGPATAGQALTASSGGWTGDDVVIAYQWQRCDADGTHCADIAGATDPSYTPTGDDVGKALQVVVTASNDTGSLTATSDPVGPIAAGPSAVPTPTPTPASPAPTGGDVPVGGEVLPADITGVEGVADPAFLAVPGSLVAPSRCQQLAGGARYRRVNVRGVGVVRVRAYTPGPSSPVQVTTEAVRKLKRVTYTIDGRPLRAARKGHGAVLGPKELRRLGHHRLVATVKGRKGKARRIVLRLKTVPCQTLFTAQRWRTKVGQGLRLRVDALSSIHALSFKVPAALMPRQGRKARVIGFARIYTAGAGAPVRFALTLPKQGRKPVLLGKAGTPTIAYQRGTLSVSSLPDRAAVAEITIYRVTELDRRTSGKRFRLRASVTRDGAARRTFAQRPRAPR